MSQVLRQRPKWIPDNETDQCMRCDAAFTAANRRHHCRCCGYVVCHKCSPHKALLPDMGYKKSVRVCKHCFVLVLEVRDGDHRVIQSMDPNKQNSVMIHVL